MTEKNPSSETLSKGRRGALKLILAGGAAGTVAALPKAWTRPVVEAVVLPAHAQLSTLTASYQHSGNASLLTTGSLLDLVVPAAVAGPPVPPINYTICITVAAGVAHVDIYSNYYCCTVSGEGPIGGGIITLGPCGNITTATCSVSISEDLKTASGNLIIIGTGEDYTDDYTADVLAGGCVTV